MGRGLVLDARLWRECAEMHRRRGIGDSRDGGPAVRLELLRYVEIAVFVVIAEAGDELPFFRDRVVHLCIAGYAGVLSFCDIDAGKVGVGDAIEAGLRAIVGRLFVGIVLMEEIRPGGPAKRGVAVSGRAETELLRENLYVVPCGAIVVDDGDDIRRGEVAVDGRLVITMVVLPAGLGAEVEGGARMLYRKGGVQGIVDHFPDGVLVQPEGMAKGVGRACREGEGAPVAVVLMF